MINKSIKYFVKTGAIGIAAIVLYSSGLLGLRPTDTSILRAGSSIVMGVILAGAFGLSTHQLLLPDKKHIKTLTANLDVTKLNEKLKEHIGEKYMGDLASQALSQVDRLNRSVERAEYEIGNKFEKSSLTYQQYYASVIEAVDCAFTNLEKFSKRLDTFKNDEVVELKNNYLYDNIPDEIQERQISLMDKNYDIGKEALRANEELIVGLDELAIELATANIDVDSKANEERLERIKKLTENIKYYTSA